MSVIRHYWYYLAFTLHRFALFYPVLHKKSYTMLHESISGEDTMDTIIETLTGAIKVLENIDEDHHDARIQVVITALEKCVGELDEENS